MSLAPVNMEKKKKSSDSSCSLNTFIQVYVSNANAMKV